MDERLKEITELVREIHQRQQERTIPAIEKIEKTLYGNGKKGLCDDVSELKTTITVMKWVTGIGVAALGVFIAIFEFILKVAK